MNKLIEDDAQVDDPILTNLSDVINPVAEKIETSENHALLVLGAKYLEGEDEESSGIQSYINAVGFYGILAEALYQELSDQLDNGHKALFSVFRDVVRDLEDDFGISPDDEIDPDETTSTTLH